jgi:hypothetical protein
VLLDAVIVIKTHELLIWESLIDKIPLMVCATVVEDEAFYFDTEPGVKRFPIDLKGSIDIGKIIRVEATLEEFQKLHNIFDKLTLEGLDPGELEALALVNGRRLGDVLFCTSDKAAIRALALLGFSEEGISLEELLEKIGLQKTLEEHHTREWFNHYLRIGQQDRIMGIGLKSNPQSK